MTRQERKQYHSSSIREFKVSVLDRHEIISDWINTWKPMCSVGFTDYDDPNIQRMMNECIIQAIYVYLSRRSAYLDYDHYYYEFKVHVVALMMELGFRRRAVQDLEVTEEYQDLLTLLLETFTVRESLSGYEMWNVRDTFQSYIVFENVGDKRILDWYRSQEIHELNYSLNDESGVVRDVGRMC